MLALEKRCVKGIVWGRTTVGTAKERNCTRESLHSRDKRDSKRLLFIWIYRLIFAPIALVLSPKYLLKMKRRGDYKGALSMRLGIGIKEWPRNSGKRRIWIQAVSLGEILVIEAFLRKLADDPKIELLLTTTTSTGYRLANDKYSEICDRIYYFPLDFWPFNRKFWKRMRPDLAICAETELWPEHMQQASNAGVPMVLINGRVSDRSFKYAQKINWIYRKHMNLLDRVLAISDQDASRFIEMGVAPERVIVSGNLKLDVSIGSILEDRQKAVLKQSLGLGEEFVLLGSSTWPGEEEVLLSIFRSLRKSLPLCRLLLVPRHAERRNEIRTMLERNASDLSFGFKSESESFEYLDVLVADTSGELRVLTQLSDLAFIGKSLPPHREGQTPIECGLLGVPVVYGPGMSNFRSVRDGMLEMGAAIQVPDASSLEEALESLALSESARREMSENQTKWAAASRGALARTFDAVETLVKGDTRKRD